jgi:hypothetical protein
MVPLETPLAVARFVQVTQSLHLAVDTVQGPLNFFRIEGPLIVDVFSGRNFFDDVNRCVPLIICPQKQHQWLFLFRRSFFGIY